MAKLINLTPHKIIIVDEKCPSTVSEEEVVKHIVLEVPPSGTVARVKVRREKVGEVNGVPVFKTVFSGVELPEPREDTVYIVSTLVLQASKRKDLVAPDTNNAVRDRNGRIIAVKSFQVGGEYR